MTRPSERQLAEALRASVGWGLSERSLCKPASRPLLELGAVQRFVGEYAEPEAFLKAVEELTGLAADMIVANAPKAEREHARKLHKAISKLLILEDSLRNRSKTAETRRKEAMEILGLYMPVSTWRHSHEVDLLCELARQLLVIDAAPDLDVLIDEVQNRLYMDSERGGIEPDQHVEEIRVSPNGEGLDAVGKILGDVAMEAMRRGSASTVEVSWRFVDGD